MSKTSSPPKFSFTKKATTQGESGGLFCFCIDEIPVCDCLFWAFASCGVATLQGFRHYTYYKKPEAQWTPNIVASADVINKYHKEIIDFLSSARPDNSWMVQEYLMCLTNYQLLQLKGLLADPRVSLRDQWKNKAHDPNTIFLYRISTTKDFK